MMDGRGIIKDPYGDRAEPSSILDRPLRMIRTNGNAFTLGFALSHRGSASTTYTTQEARSGRLGYHREPCNGFAAREFSTDAARDPPPCCRHFCTVRRFSPIALHGCYGTGRK